MDADQTLTYQTGLRLTGTPKDGLFETWVADLYYNYTDHLMTDSKRVSSTNGPGALRGWFMRTDALSRNYGTSFDATVAADRYGEWRVGGEFDRRHWDSDNVLQLIENEMIPDVVLDTLGMYAEGSYDFDSPFSLQLGLRLDRFATAPGGDTTFLSSLYGKVGDRDFIEPGAFASLRWELSKAAALFAGLGSAARSPNPQELYLQVEKPNAQHWAGNPNLDAPRSNELTAGLEYQVEAWGLRGRVFHSWLDDYIYPVLTSTAGGDIQSYDNLDASLYGVEFSAEYRFTDSWSVDAALAWQQGEKRSRPVNSTNDVLAEIPPLRAQATLKYADGRNRISFETRASQAQTRIDPDLNEQDMGSWITFSIRGQRDLSKHWTLGLAVENLFDATYALHNAQVRNPFSAFTVVDEPGRVVKASLRYEF